MQSKSGRFCWPVLPSRSDHVSGLSLSAAWQIRRALIFASIQAAPLRPRRFLGELATLVSASSDVVTMGSGAERSAIDTSLNAAIACKSKPDSR